MTPNHANSLLRSVRRLIFHPNDATAARAEAALPFAIQLSRRMEPPPDEPTRACQEERRQLEFYLFGSC